MSNKCTVSWCDLPKYKLTFDLDEALIEQYPALNIALCALSKILTNDFLLSNFSAHFVPFDQYTGILPHNVSEIVINQIRNAFTQSNIPSIILQEDELLIARVPCAVYGNYLGREKETDINIIYLNKQLIDCSKASDHSKDVIEYSALILFTIIHELGHWSFHHYTCNMDHDLATPKGVLMEEAGDAIEFLLFGFRIQHYGPEHPKFMIDEIVTKFNKSYRIVPFDYLKKLFQENTYASKYQ
ncbi:unnamed protein product [Rotaria sp. Silwood2]|nr:unnamed protein product [Rotaria sp. Silwood2]CAF4567425.1 unnamed protein product [Rotaria sp. Silwood2]